MIEKRSKLGESQTLQQVSRDVDEIEAWISEKLQTATDESYKDPTNIQVSVLVSEMLLPTHTDTDVTCSTRTAPDTLMTFVSDLQCWNCCSYRDVTKSSRCQTFNSSLTVSCFCFSCRSCW